MITKWRSTKWLKKELRKTERYRKELEEVLRERVDERK